MTTNKYFSDMKYTNEYFLQENVCRLCWMITNDAKSLQNDATLAQNIEDQIGVKVKGHLIQTVCRSCADKIESFGNFKNVCLEADEKLKNIITPDPLEETLNFESKYQDLVVINKEADLELRLLAQEADKEDFDISPLKSENMLSNFDIDFRLCDDIDEGFLPNDNDYCYICNISFKSPDIKKNHDAEIHKFKQDSFKCYICKKTFTEFSHKISHEIQCKFPKRTSCIKTEKLYLNERPKVKTSTNKYIYRAGVSKPIFKTFRCENCPRTFRLREEFLEHNKEHLKKEKYVCEICGSVFKYKGNLSTHIMKHTNQKRYKCPHCDYKSVERCSITAHIRRVHIRERKFACHICPLRCFTKHNLTVHLKTHFGIKDFKCELCPKSYTHKIALQRHIQLFHEGLVGQFKCTYCTSQYNTMGHLRKHILKKHGKRIKVSKGSYVEVDESKTGDRIEVNHDVDHTPEEIVTLTHS